MRSLWTITAEFRLIHVYYKNIVRLFDDRLLIPDSDVRNEKPVADLSRIAGICSILIIAFQKTIWSSAVRRSVGLKIKQNAKSMQNMEVQHEVQNNNRLRSSLMTVFIQIAKASKYK